MTRSKLSIGDKIGYAVMHPAGFVFKEATIESAVGRNLYLDNGVTISIAQMVEGKEAATMHHDFYRIKPTEEPIAEASRKVLRDYGDKVIKTGQLGKREDGYRLAMKKIVGVGVKVKGTGASPIVRKEELEMDQPNKDRGPKPLNFILDKGKYKGPTDYNGETPDERQIVAGRKAAMLKAPDRNGNGDDVFSATGIRRSVTAVNKDADGAPARYNAANEETVIEALDSKVKDKISTAHMTDIEHHSDGKHVTFRRDTFGSDSEPWAKGISDTLHSHKVAHEVVGHGLYSDRKGPHYKMTVKLK